MASIYQLNDIEIMAFFLTLVRISAFVVSWPVFGGSGIPNSVKVLFSLIVTLVVFPVIDRSQVQLDIGSASLIVLILKETAIGLIFGYLSRMFFFALNVAGDIISTSMGLSQAQVFNPAMGARSTAIEQVLIMLASLLFLAINGHHLFLSGLIDTFRVLPMNNELISMSAFKNIGHLAQEIIAIGVQISMPVMLSILFVNVAMGIIGRAVPQINVLITSLPVNILVGFFYFSFRFACNDGWIG